MEGSTCFHNIFLGEPCIRPFSRREKVIILAFHTIFGKEKANKTQTKKGGEHCLENETPAVNCRIFFQRS